MITRLLLAPPFNTQYICTSFSIHDFQFLSSHIINATVSSHSASSGMIHRTICMRYRYSSAPEFAGADESLCLMLMEIDSTHLHPEGNYLGQVSDRADIQSFVSSSILTNDVMLPLRFRWHSSYFFCFSDYHKI